MNYPIVIPHHPNLDKSPICQSIGNLNSGLLGAPVVIVLNNLHNVEGKAVDRVYEEAKRYGFNIVRLRKPRKFGEVRKACAEIMKKQFYNAPWILHLDDDCIESRGFHSVNDLLSEADRMNAGVAGFVPPGSSFGEWQNRVGDFTEHLPVLGGFIAIHRDNPTQYKPWVNAVDIQYSLETLSIGMPVCRSTRTVLLFDKGRRPAAHTSSYTEIQDYWRGSGITISEHFDGKKYRIRVYGL